MMVVRKIWLITATVISICALSACSMGLFGPQRPETPQGINIYQQGQHPQGEVRIIKQIEVDRAFINKPQPITEKDVLPIMQKQAFELKANAIVNLICTGKQREQMSFMHCIGDAAVVQ